MSATSATGTGPGAANKPTSKELATFTNGPITVATGLVTLSISSLSPGGHGQTVNLPNPLPGGADRYIVLLTPMSDETPWVVGMTDDSDGNFSEFTIVCSHEIDVMYAVLKRGYAPQL